MNKEEFCKEMIEIANKNNLMLLEEHIDKFYRYMNLILEWNEKINLTAIVEPKEIIKKHFIDSLTILPYIKENQNIIDVGTGAGFPGIPINIVNSQNNIILLDSLQKRINFIEKVIKELELKNIKAIHSRAEDYAIKQKEIFDIAVSRAVANMSTLAEYLLPYVKIYGIAICLKGPNVNEELEKSKKAIHILGGKIEKIEKLSINNEDERNLIIIRKIKNSPKAYPRKAGKAQKDPIK